MKSIPNQSEFVRLTLRHRGLEADQKVIAAHGCYAMTATTALTAQNTLGVQDIHYIPPEFLQRQIDAVCNDIGVDVVKTGIDRSVLIISSR
jgi:ATP-dependent RNA helicase DDX5/DBP2